MIRIIDIKSKIIFVQGEGCIDVAILIPDPFRSRAWNIISVRCKYSIHVKIINWERNIVGKMVRSNNRHCGQQR